MVHDKEQSYEITKILLEISNPQLYPLKLDKLESRSWRELGGTSPQSSVAPPQLSRDSYNHSKIALQEIHGTTLGTTIRSSTFSPQPQSLQQLLRSLPIIH